MDERKAVAMGDLWMAPLFFGGLLLVAMVVGRMGSRSARAGVRATLDDSASQLGLSARPAPKVMLAGTYNGLAVKVEVNEDGDPRKNYYYGEVYRCEVPYQAPPFGIASSKSTERDWRTWLRYRAALPAASPRMNLRIAALERYERYDELSATPRITTGDGGFDEYVHVEGRNAARVREWLTDDVRRAIRSLLTRYHGAVVFDHEVVLPQRGMPSSDELTARVKTFSGMVADLQAAIEQSPGRCGSHDIGEDGRCSSCGGILVLPDELDTFVRERVGLHGLDDFRALAAGFPGGRAGCPRCGNEMNEVPIKGVVLDFCPDCPSLWADPGELERLGPL